MHFEMLVQDAARQLLGRRGLELCAQHLKPLGIPGEELAQQMPALLRGNQLAEALQLARGILFQRGPSAGDAFLVHLESGNRIPLAAGIS